MIRHDLGAGPSGGTSQTAITLDTNGTCSTTNNVEMYPGHVKAIVDTMKERNIPPYASDDYLCVSHPTTYRNFKNQLETINSYTNIGIQRVYSGEVGRFEGTRFLEQTFLPKGGAADSTTYDAWSGTADVWNNAKLSWAFFFGADTCTEAICVPEEIRASIPTDFGRSNWGGRRQ